MRAVLHASVSVAVAIATMLVTSAGAEQIVGLTSTNGLIVFDSASPGSTSTVPITGLAGGDVVSGIDYRPATGQLYLLGSDRIYTVNPLTGAATQVGPSGVFALGGNLTGFDVNPEVDRLRIVTGAGSNLRLNPNDGTLTAVDTSLFYDNTTADGDPIDPNAGATPTIAGIAYSNNVPNAAATIVFGLDAALDLLVTLNPPNAGVLNTIGPLGVDTSGQLGFDISGATGVAYATLGVGGLSSLFQINLATGAATLVGAIGNGQVSLTGLTVVPAAEQVPEPGTVALLGLALGATGWSVRRRRR